VKKFRRYLYSFWRNSGTCQTDRRTPGDSIYRAYAYASRGKNRYGRESSAIGMGLAIVDPLAKFKECSFSYSINIYGGFKFLKGSSNPDHALFMVNFSPLRWELQ